MELGSLKIVFKMCLIITQYKLDLYCFISNLIKLWCYRKKIVPNNWKEDKGKHVVLGNG